jgi:hypothetical protein
MQRTNNYFLLPQNYYSNNPDLNTLFKLNASTESSKIHSEDISNNFIEVTISVYKSSVLKLTDLGKFLLSIVFVRIRFLRSQIHWLHNFLTSNRQIIYPTTL